MEGASTIFSFGGVGVLPTFHGALGPVPRPVDARIHYCVMMHAPLAVLALAQAADAAAKHHGPIYAVTHALTRFGIWISHIFAPLGLWGLGGLSVLDSALVPLPGGLIGWVVFYVAAQGHNFLLCALVTSVMSTLGSLLPYYIGRVGGETFLLKKINRERYERMRDRFERQEFVAIMLPAMSPPPMPLKLFEFCAGVFEMRVQWYLGAMFLGKFIQFLVVAIFAWRYGTAAAGMLQGAFHRHSRGILEIVGAVLVVLGIFIVRRMFARRGERLPIEEDESARAGVHTVVEE